MNQISLDIDKNSSQLIISEKTPNFIPKARLYLENYLSASLDNNKYLIPYTETNKSITLQKISEYIKRFGYEPRYSEQLECEFNQIIIEENNFIKFSDKAEKIRNNNIVSDELSNFISVLESKMVRKPYKLQLLSSFHLAFSQNACNFSVPGAGKTTVVYGALTYLKSLPDEDKKHIDKLLVIGPLSSFGPWEQEYEKCFNRKPISKRITSNLSKGQKDAILFNPENIELILISYQGVISSQKNIKYFLKNNKVMVVLDEAHKIKNTNSGLWAETILSLSEFCKSRVVLTGTPVPNGYQDLYNLYKFIWPQNNVLGFNKFQLKSLTTSPNQNIIKELILRASPFFIRITKKDLGLPKPIENSPIFCKMGQQQKEIYDYINDIYMKYLSKQSSNNNFFASLQKARIIRLMQLATNPNLLKKPLDTFYREQGIPDNIYIDDTEIKEKISKYSEIPAKFITVGEIIINILKNSSEKVIVWSNFIQNIKDFQQYLHTLNINSKLLYGDIPVDKDDDLHDEETRESIVREFHNPNSSFRVIIANPFAASESISLHKACHNAIYMDRTFNAANFIQSKDRIHRVGLNADDKINYYYIVSENTIDLRIHERLIIKEKRMLEIIESQEIPLFKENDSDTGTINDIKAILNEYEYKSKANHKS